MVGSQTCVLLSLVRSSRDRRWEFPESLRIETLSPPVGAADLSPPCPWDDPLSPQDADLLALLRDDYAYQVSKGLEARAVGAAAVLAGRSVPPTDDDISNTVSNLLDCELLCGRLPHERAARLAEELESTIRQSLSSSGAAE